MRERTRLKLGTRGHPQNSRCGFRCKLALWGGAWEHQAGRRRLSVSRPVDDNAVSIDPADVCSGVPPTVAVAPLRWRQERVDAVILAWAFPSAGSSVRYVPRPV